MSTAKKFSPVFFLLAAGCFFMPFFDLACSGERLATLNGIQLVTGTHVEQYVQYHPGFWLAQFLFLASAGYSIFVFSIEKKKASP